VDDADRLRWRERLATAYPAFCPICKTSLEVQAQLKSRTGVEFERHEECGHVTMYRSHALGWLHKAEHDRELARQDRVAQS
jgi:hypothetical protein